MEAVNVHIGPLIFDNADYDAEAGGVARHRRRPDPPLSRRVRT